MQPDESALHAAEVISRGYENKAAYYALVADMSRMVYSHANQDSGWDNFAITADDIAKMYHDYAEDIRIARNEVPGDITIARLNDHVRFVGTEVDSIENLYGNTQTLLGIIYENLGRDEFEAMHQRLTPIVQQKTALAFESLGILDGAPLDKFQKIELNVTADHIEPVFEACVHELEALIPHQIKIIGAKNELSDAHREKLSNQLTDHLATEVTNYRRDIANLRRCETREQATMVLQDLGQFVETEIAVLSANLESFKEMMDNESQPKLVYEAAPHYIEHGDRVLPRLRQMEQKIMDCDLDSWLGYVQTQDRGRSRG